MVKQAIVRNKLSVHATAWMNSKNIKLRDKKLIWKSYTYMILYISQQILELENTVEVRRGWGQEGSNGTYKGATCRALALMEMSRILTASAPISWLWYCTPALFCKVLPLGETGWRISDLSVLFLANACWVYYYLKIKFLTKMHNFRIGFNVSFLVLYTI